MLALLETPSKVFAIIALWLAAFAIGTVIVRRWRARELARDAAIAFGRTRGVDVVGSIGHDYIDLWITKLVKQRKVA